MADFVTPTFRDHVSGTDYNGKTFTFSAHPSGTLTDVEFITDRGTLLREGEGMTITDAVGWIFGIDSQTIEWSPGVLKFRIRTTSSHGVKKDFMRGTWNIL